MVKSVGFQVFFCALMSTVSLGMSAPYIQIFSTASGAATKIFDIIDHEPHINLSKGVGKQSDKVNGFIAFEDVHFQYPSRSDVKVIAEQTTNSTQESLYVNIQASNLLQYIIINLCF